MTWSSSAKCKEALPSGVGSCFFQEEREGGRKRAAIKSSGSLSLPGLGWQSVNRGSQSGFIRDV